MATSEELAHPAQEFRRNDLVVRPQPTTAAQAVQAAALTQVASAGEDPRRQVVPMQPWGSPMSEPVPVRDPAPRPDTESAWGRGERLLPDGTVKELARVQLERSQSLTLSVDVEIDPGTVEANGPDFGKALTVWAKVVFGNGSTNATRYVRCDYRFDVPLVASFVQLIVFIGLTEVPIGQDPTPYASHALAKQTTAQVEGQVARGLRGLPYVATVFVTADGADEGQLIEGAARLMSIEAHLAADTGGAGVFLQLYDTNLPLAAGLTPVMEYPLGATPYPGVILTRWLNPRGFSQGVHYVVSSTSGSYAPSGNAVHIEVEPLLL